MFGITSAPEKYQKIVSDVLQGCEGVANIADDVIVHGCGIEQHDKNLLAVLNRLGQCGLTLNARKCQFRLLKLTFFGHDLSKNGVAPSEEKVAAVQSGDWSQCKMPHFICVKNELCVLGKLVLRGTRILIPQSLRKQVLHLAHEGHQGIVKMKGRLNQSLVA